MSLWNVKLPGDPTCMVNMYVQSLSLEMTVVSCIVTNSDGHTKGLVLLYSGSKVIHKISTLDPVTCVVFGKFGQEENALVMISSSEKQHVALIVATLNIYDVYSMLFCSTEGKVDIKLLKRTATFDVYVRPTLTTHTQGSLSIPKRSNVFIEQTLREREHCTGKYNIIALENPQ